MPINVPSTLQEARHAVTRGDYTMASELCHRVLKQQKEPQALLLLSHIAITAGRYDDGLQHLIDAVKLQPANARLRTRLGAMLTMQGQHTRALAQFDKALALQPGLDEAIAGKAGVYEHQVRHERARRLLRPFEDDPSPPPAVAAVLLRLLNEAGDYERMIEIGERVVAADHPPSMPLRDAWLTLARAYERCGDYEKAFHAAAQGNAIRKAPFDHETHSRHANALIETFTAQRLAAMPRSTRLTDLAVFIVGMPRSGSTLIERIIAAHPEAHGAGEISALHVLVADMPRRIGSRRSFPRCVEELSAEHVEALSEAYLSDLRRLCPSRQARRICNKDLGNHRYVGLINLLFPQAKVIHCRRDPIDTCLSCYLERLRPANVPYASDLHDLGFAYREYERLMAHWREVTDVPMLEIQYEEMVADQEQMTRRLLEFLELPWREECLQFHQQERRERTLSYEQVRRPLYGSSVGRAERYGKLLDPLREALQGVSSQE